MSSKLKDWEREFRTAAVAHHYTRFREHLRFLGLPDEPALMMRGTLNVMRACAAYAEIDGRPFDKFLAMQKYNPAGSPHARYAFTFDLHGKAFARVLVGSKIAFLDLADLYNHPWMDYEVMGYGQVWISHADHRIDLTKKEIKFLEKQVTYDLRYDYEEDELDFWFDDLTSSKYLLVTVQDHYELDEEDEE